MDDMKQKILDLASDLFMVQGYLATSTRQIAKNLNITQPAIYHHFKNKEDIYVQVLTNFSSKIGKELSDILNSEEMPEEILYNMSRYLIETHPVNFSLMMRDMKEELPEEMNKKIFILWEENYFQPFKRFFASLDVSISEKVKLENIPLHYLRCLSAYIEESLNSYNVLPIKEFVYIYLRGIL